MLFPSGLSVTWVITLPAELGVISKKWVGGGKWVKALDVQLAGLAAKQHIAAWQRGGGRVGQGVRHSANRWDIRPLLPRFGVRC